MYRCISLCYELFLIIKKDIVFLSLEKPCAAFIKYMKIKIQYQFVRYMTGCSNIYRIYSYFHIFSNFNTQVARGE